LERETVEIRGGGCVVVDNAATAEMCGERVDGSVRNVSKAGENQAFGSFYGGTIQLHQPCN
jgi:hypothetical protein